MRRWLGRILTTLSLLLLVGTVGMWVASQWVRVTVSVSFKSGEDQRPVVRSADFTGYRGTLEVNSRTGTVDLSADTFGRFRDDWQSLSSRRFIKRIPETFRERTSFNGYVHEGMGGWGFVWHKSTPTLRGLARLESYLPRGPSYPLDDVVYRSIALPWWFLALGFSLLPARAAYRWHRARRRRGPGQCRRCGYDCRATPHAAGPRLAVCPECGHPQTDAAAAA